MSINTKEGSFYHYIFLRLLQSAGSLETSALKKFTVKLSLTANSSMLNLDKSMRLPTAWLYFFITMIKNKYRQSICRNNTAYCIQLFLSHKYNV